MAPIKGGINAIRGNINTPDINELKRYLSTVLTMKSNVEFKKKADPDISIFDRRRDILSTKEKTYEALGEKLKKKIEQQTSNHLLELMKGNTDVISRLPLENISQTYFEDPDIQNKISIDRLISNNLLTTKLAKLFQEKLQITSLNGIVKRHKNGYPLPIESRGVFGKKSHNELKECLRKLGILESEKKKPAIDERKNWMNVPIDKISYSSGRIIQKITNDAGFPIVTLDDFIKACETYGIEGLAHLRGISAGNLLAILDGCKREKIALPSKLPKGSINPLPRPDRPENSINRGRLSFLRKKLSIILPD